MKKVSSWWNFYCLQINIVLLISDDIFTIDELAVYEGDHNEQTYAVAGDILDGVLPVVKLKTNIFTNISITLCF